ncbi:sigma factor-like helix-turn-helix DNA-binding protein [Actinoplanes sp. NPDC049599]|uniref:sigma factor-like helix-turn-helix DNA-binding protein n=1 Tax=Actinoplanes sp. NPDC049599 TaxID=3363903 RepID=UPI00378C01AF
MRSHVSWLRRRSSGERPGRLAAGPPGGAAPDFADQHAARPDLWSRLDRLTRAQCAVLVLRYYEDLDDRQIGEVLRCATSTVRVHAARGLARLRTGRVLSIEVNQQDVPISGDELIRFGEGVAVAG